VRETPVGRLLAATSRVSLRGLGRQLLGVPPVFVGSASMAERHVHVEHPLPEEVNASQWRQDMKRVENIVRKGRY